MKKILMIIVAILFLACGQAFGIIYEEGSDFTELAAAPAADDWLIGLIDISDTRWSRGN